MKLKHLILPLLIVLIFSCSKENETTVIAGEEETEVGDEGTNDPPPPVLKLDSVVVEQPLTEEVDIYRFNDGQLTSINDKIATYEDGRIARLEQGNNRETFFYDSQGRLIEYVDMVGTDAIFRNVTYFENEIRIQESLITIDVVEVSHITFFLDNNNRVIKEEFTDPFDQLTTTDLSYDQSGNIVEVRINNTTFTYSYNGDEVTFGYRFLELMFGTSWKNYALIYKGRIINSIRDGWLVELANTYPIETQSIYPGGSVFTNTLSYDFDDNGNILLRSEFKDNGTLEVRTTYDYE